MPATLTTGDLLKLKERIERAKAERNRLEGEVRALEKQLEEEFGTSDPDALEKKAEKMEREAKRLRAEVAAGMEKLEKELEQ